MEQKIDTRIQKTEHRQQKIDNRWLYFILSVFCALACLCSVSSVFADVSTELTVVACCGVPGDAPENTFATFERAIQLGANGIKIDVRKTKDGKLILMQDPTIDRTTDGKGYVESLLYDEIQLYDAGSWMNKKFKGQRVPLLSDVLKFVKANNIKAVLDVKQQEIEDQILLLIEELGVAKQIYFWGSLRGIRGLESELPGKDLVFVAPENLTKEAIENAHAERKLAVTTMLDCDDRESMKEKLMKGIDVVLVDYPCLVKDILQKEGISASSGPKLKSAESLSLGVITSTPPLEKEGFDVRALIDIVTEPDADKSRMAALSLAGYPSAETVPQLVKLSKSWNVVARRNATWALGFLKDKKAVETLITKLSDKDVEVRREAALGLKRQSDPASISELINTLLHDENAKVRFDAARALGDIEDKIVVSPLITALKNDTDWDIRSVCARALGQIKDAKAVEALGTILVADTFCQEACWTREMSARALAEIGKPSVETLIAALRDNEECTRRRASWALIYIGQPAAPAVASALFDPNHLVRRRAALILGWIEDDAALYPLLRAIKDDEPTVRQTAAWALGRLGDPRAKSALNVAVNDKSNPVKENALEAIKRLTLD